MKRNIYKNLLFLLRSKGILAMWGGLLLMSCGAQMGGYSETDGVYYDPNKDTLPEGVIINDSRNRVGEYYDYNQDPNVIQNAQANSKEQQNRYNKWNNTNVIDSDWGFYAGSETNYYNNSWGWGYPWGWYGVYSPYWGWNYSWGWGVGVSWGWGSFGWRTPYWGYSPYLSSYYYPFWGGYYGSWHWIHEGYWDSGYYNRPVYRRSGVGGGGFQNTGVANAVYRTNTNSSGFRNTKGNSGFRNTNDNGFRDMNLNGGFRNSNSGGFRNNNGGFRNGNSGNGFRNTQSNDGFRNPFPQARPNYQPSQLQQPRYHNDNRGFRSSGGFNSGGGGFRGSFR